MTNPEPLTVTHNPESRRFELEKDGHQALLAYRLAEGKIIFTHTGVPAEFSGQGIGSLLADGIGDTIRVSLATDSVHEVEVCGGCRWNHLVRSWTGGTPGTAPAKRVRVVVTPKRK